MPEHRRDADRTSHVGRCCSKQPCFGRGEESVAQICFVQLGEASRPRVEKPRLSNMFAFTSADTDRKQKNGYKIKMRPHPRPTRGPTQPRQKYLDGNCAKARRRGRGLHCVQHDWVQVLFRLHHDDGCNKQHGAALCPAAGQAACFGNHVPWTRDTGKQPLKVKSASSPKHFLGEEEFGGRFGLHFHGGLEAPCGNFLGSPNSYSHWNGHMQRFWAWTLA